MKVAKDGIRSIVRIGYDGRVHKTFRGTDRDKRWANEVKVLKVLEARGCDFVPRLLECDEEELSITTTNCGHPAPNVSDRKAKELFDSLEEEFGVVHDDPFPRNITYNDRRGRFCIIDFELAQIKENPKKDEGNRPDEEVATRTLEWAGMTREGTRRSGNQDALSVFSSDAGWAKNEELTGERSIDDEGIIFAVSDGMGGPAGGAVASSMVVQELRRFLPAKMGNFQSLENYENVLDAAIRDLHDYVTRNARKRPGQEDMGATVVCGLFFRTAVHFASVGDSRFYLYRDGDLMQLTYDHTYVGTQFRRGKLNEREARMHPAKNILNQAIGGQCKKVEPHVDECALEHGDWFLICSDGIVDGLWNKNIAETFQEADEKGWSAEETCQRILDWACDVSGKDDTTLFVVRVR